MINPKIWQVKAKDPAMQYILSRRLGVSPLMAQFLINRGIFTVAAANEFLNASLGALHSPMLMRDMDRGVALAARALDAG
ncbi:MAG: single-stranded-DNA-specific exonuclease RecJ, partial [Firmicutes bacterium]|nr:single-stranded-DNA-specific exonuclease RecJ [Bacillota bacterium]